MCKKFSEVSKKPFFFCFFFSSKAIIHHLHIKKWRQKGFLRRFSKKFPKQKQKKLNFYFGCKLIFSGPNIKNWASKAFLMRFTKLFFFKLWRVNESFQENHCMFSITRELRNVIFSGFEWLQYWLWSFIFCFVPCTKKSKHN
jgi:hypothetical protein